MIILVKVNNTYTPGTDPKLVSYRSWGCTRLLNDPDFRNQFKYLVAYYHGHIVGTFCIHGVSLDLPFHDKRRKVKFLLEETDDKCDQNIKNIIQPLIVNRNPRILKAMSFCYLDINYLSQSEINIGSYNCNCSIEDIPVLESEKILVDDQPNKESHVVRMPSNLWFKLTINRNTWDSFSHPNSKETKVVIIYPHNGNVRYDKSDNSSGTLTTSRIPIDTSQLLKIINVISVFHHDPVDAIQKINNSKINTHVAHHNSLEIEFEAFNDSKLTNRIQHGHWSGNVLQVEDGFLKSIYELIF